MADQTILQETLDNAIVDGDYLIYWKTATSVQRRVARSSLIGATLTGAGTIATAGYTLTVPATGTAALRDVANTFTAAQTVQSPGAATVPLTVQAAASPTAALQEWKDSSGNVLASILPTGGVRSQSVSVTDDTAITLYTGAFFHGILLLWVTGSSSEIASSMLAIRSGLSSPFATILTGGTLLETTTSDVTGTTGTDTKLTVAATTSALKVENRLGATRTVNWLRIG